ncbi:MAG: diguanylate cyclase [Armatimonadetes bacterium]|nr:diguanylate cyclase [Armatimonadota bacterium]
MVADVILHPLSPMRTIAELGLNKLTVSTDRRVSEALSIMQRSNQAALTVEENGQAVGMLTLEAAVLSDSDATVLSVMRGIPFRIDADALVRQAAKDFVNEQAEFAAVYKDQKFVGLVSALMLITELGRSWDPLTGLSWSDRLRDWGVDCLDNGQEISIVFFDLNDFGVYNKKHGHIIGDNVLKGFARLLTQAIDPNRDVLVRYGGDEFAIGTTRNREETMTLLENLGEPSFSIPGLEEPVGFCYGVSGGKRTQEPSRNHVAATLDNLINLASQACLASKPGAQKGKILLDAPKAEPIRSGHVPSGHELQAIAENAAKNLDSKSFRITETLFVMDESGSKVAVIGERIGKKGTKRVSGESSLNGDIDQAAIQAVHDAFDRLA